MPNSTAPQLVPQTLTPNTPEVELLRLTVEAARMTKRIKALKAEVLGRFESAGQKKLCREGLGSITYVAPFSRTLVDSKECEKLIESLGMPLPIKTAEVRASIRVKPD